VRCRGSFQARGQAQSFHLSGPNLELRPGLLKIVIEAGKRPLKLMLLLQRS
jgi:hypothetical protein